MVGVSLAFLRSRVLHFRGPLQLCSPDGSTSLCFSNSHVRLPWPLILSCNERPVEWGGWARQLHPPALSGADVQWIGRSAVVVRGAIARGSGNGHSRTLKPAAQPKFSYREGAKRKVGLPSGTRPLLASITNQAWGHPWATQDSLPAAGQLCRTGIARWVPLWGFCVRYMASSSPRLGLAHPAFM
jgi:hypothetical protein